MLRATDMIAQLPSPLDRKVTALEGGHVLGVTAAETVRDHVVASTS